MRYVVMGTGTEVGKTEVAAALLRGLRRLPVDCVGLKPVQTGSDGLSDVDRLGHAAGRSVSALYSYPEPVSPHLAARWRNQVIQVERIVEWVSVNSAPATVVETAGGCFSPVTAEHCNLDLTLALQPDRIVLVAPGRLGVLHDVGATLRGFALEAPAWVTRIRLVVFGLAGQMELERQSEELRRVVLPRAKFELPLVAMSAQPSWSEEDQLVRAVMA